MGAAGRSLGDPGVHSSIFPLYRPGLIFARSRRTARVDDRASLAGETWCVRGEIPRAISLLLPRVVRLHLSRKIVLHGRRGTHWPRPSSRHRALYLVPVRAGYSDPATQFDFFPFDENSGRAVAAFMLVTIAGSPRSRAEIAPEHTARARKIGAAADRRIFAPRHSARLRARGLLALATGGMAAIFFSRRNRARAGIADRCGEMPSAFDRAALHRCLAVTFDFEANP